MQSPTPCLLINNLRDQTSAPSLQALSEARCGLSVEDPLHLVYVLQPEPAEFPAIHCWSAWHSAFCSLPAPQRAVASRLGIDERCEQGVLLWYESLICQT